MVSSFSLIMPISLQSYSFIFVSNMVRQVIYEYGEKVKVQEQNPGKLN